jgi:hypothetical protein
MRVQCVCMCSHPTSTVVCCFWFRSPQSRGFSRKRLCVGIACTGAVLPCMCVTNVRTLHLDLVAMHPCLDDSLSAVVVGAGCWRSTCIRSLSSRQSSSPTRTSAPKPCMCLRHSCGLACATLWVRSARSASLVPPFRAVVPQINAVRPGLPHCSPTTASKRHAAPDTPFSPFPSPHGSSVFAPSVDVAHGHAPSHTRDERIDPSPP